jgi:hypothetical protein
MKKKKKKKKKKLWSVNLRTTEAEESPLVRFRYRKPSSEDMARNNRCGELLPSKD